jgi:general stress protein 26
MQSVDELLDIARGVITAALYCVLITLDEAGQANARVMQPFPPEADLTLWFGTSPRSRKALNIRRHPQLTVLYQNPTDNAYLTLQGTARLVDDLDQRRAHWFNGWKLYWPDGPTGDDFILIAFTPSRLELMSFSQNVTPPPYGLMPAALERQADTWALAKHYRGE